MLRPPSPHLVLGLGLLALVACGESDTPTQPPTESAPVAAPAATLASNSWTLRAPYPTRPGTNGFGALQLSAAVVNSAGQPIVYTIGAIDDEDCCEVPVGRYNVATDAWSFAPHQEPIGVLVYNTNGVANIGGKLYFSGGHDKSGSVVQITARTSVYDPVANTLTQKADMPKGTADGVSAVIGGLLYVLPGICLIDNTEGPACDTEPFRRLFRYNPATDHWVSKKLAPHYHRNGAGGAIDGKFYVAGGEELFTLNPIAALDVYDPATESWKTLAPLPIGGQAHGAVMQGKLFVVVQPRDASGHVTGIHAYAYNPATNRWNAKAAPQFTHEAVVLARLADGPHLVAVGGVHDANGDVVGNDTELYTP
jgi:N-acetylneuraminic acid mutarotase